MTSRLHNANWICIKFATISHIGSQLLLQIDHAQVQLRLGQNSCWLFLSVILFCSWHEIFFTFAQILMHLHWLWLQTNYALWWKTQNISNSGLPHIFPSHSTSTFVHISFLFSSMAFRYRDGKSWDFCINLAIAFVVPPSLDPLPQMSFFLTRDARKN